MRAYSRILSLVFSLLTVGLLPAFASGPGTSAAPFLKLGFGARPLGMGEAFVALADDASALYYNPAGIALPAWAGPQPASRPWEIMVGHAMHIQDIQVSQLGVVRRPFGLSLTYLSLNSIEGRTTETTAPDGTFGASDLALGLTYARSFGGLGLGFTGRYIQETIATYSANTVTSDVGALYRLRRFPVAIGASLVNLGGSLRFIDQASSLPTTLRAGIAGGMSERFPMLLTLQFDMPRDSPMMYRFGMEYSGFGPFAIRGGYLGTSSSQRDAVLGKALGSSASGLSELFGVFMGIGFRFRQGSLDYALVPYGELGNAHRFSVGLRF